MSGRKSWEVASVLGEVENVQKDIFNNYKLDIEDNLKAVDNVNQSVNSTEIQNKIDSIDDKSIKNELQKFSEWFKRSKSIKNDVKSVFSKIEAKNLEAKKLRDNVIGKNHYMNNEYAQAESIKKSLNKQKKELIMLKDESLNLKNTTIKLTNFLKNIKDLYTAKKTFLQELLDNIQARFDKEEVVLIEDFVEDIDKKVTKCEYYDNYKKTSKTQEIKTILNSARTMLNEDDFISCENLLKNIDLSLNSIFQESDKIKEDINSSFALVLKVRDLMIDEINFREAEIDLIDGNPINGFMLTCKNGDTIIFDEIKVNDGKVTVELDHQERVNGSCGVRWNDMKDVLNKNGIPLLDVLKDGKSVIHRDRLKDVRNEIKKERLK